jgi:trk system potassium uptake protein TrkA
LNKQFAIIGIGRFGSSLAHTLTSMGYEVLAIDRNIDRVQNFISEVTHVVEADATEPEALKALGIRNFDVGVVAIGDDVQASILVTVLLKDLGVKKVVAKAINDLHGRVLEKVGADKVVYPERDMGVRVAHQLISTNVLDQIELSSDYSILEIMAPEKTVGKTLKDLDLRPKYGISVMAIKRGAVDFLTKPVEREALIAAVRMALERDIARREDDRRQHDLRRDFGTLTVRERQVFSQVAVGRLNKQIAASLNTCERTVKAHRAHVMEKLHARSVAELVHIAVELEAANGPQPPDSRSVLHRHNMPAQADMAGCR